jgi:hypothetical protein
MKKQLKKGLIIGLSITTLFTSAAFVGINLRKKVQADTPIINNNENKDNQNTNYTIKENGIKIIEKAASNEGNYGTRTFTYTTDPSVNNDTINISLVDKDNNPVSYNGDDDALTIVHTFSSQTITITCNKVFTKQLILKLTSSINEKVSASVTIDFVEKLTCTPSLTANKGEKLKGSIKVETTGGSKTVDKSVTKEKYSFDESFLTSLQGAFESGAMVYEQNSGNHFGYSLNIINVKIYGVDESHINTLTTSGIDHNAFIKTIYATYTWEEYEDVDLNDTGTGQIYLYQITNTSFRNLFDGTQTVFKYSGVVNKVTYTATCGLLIDSIGATNIAPSKTEIKF